MTDQEEQAMTDPATEDGTQTEAEGEVGEAAEAASPREPMPPIESRFMFVDIAALRAKQLRRGALPRVPGLDADTEGFYSSQKLERIAMAEIDQGLIVYDIPDPEASGEGAEKES